MIKQDRGTWFSVTASGTATATATKVASAGVIYFITDIGTSTSASAGTVVVYTGTTALWQGQMGSVPLDIDFITPLTGLPGSSVSVTANGTTLTYANISGFSINNS